MSVKRKSRKYTQEQVDAMNRHQELISSRDCFHLDENGRLKRDKVYEAYGGQPMTRSSIIVEKFPQ